MNRKLFGTDGIRGRANTFPVTPEVAMKAGMAAGRVFTQRDGQRVMVSNHYEAGLTIDNNFDVMIGPNGELHGTLRGGVRRA